MEDITLAEYFALEDCSEYDAVLKHLKPVNKLGEGKINLNRLSYKQVRVCIQAMKTGKTVDQLKALFCMAYNVPSHEFLKFGVKEFFAAQNYLIKEFFNLQQREAKLLSSIDADTYLWEMAGGERLNKFSNLMPLVQLGEIYGLWPYDLESKPYTEVLTLLVLHKEKNEVQKKYNELKAKHTTK